MVTLLRRVFWLAVVGGAGFAAWSVWTGRASSTEPRPPEWPPIVPPDPPDVQAANVPAANVPAANVQAAATSTAELTTDDPVASPPEGSSTSALTWVAPDGGACPGSHPIKANSNSGIFHVPGGRFYNQTRAERCYGLAEDAEADGYRRAKS